jgi:hypothetical protein
MISVDALPLATNGSQLNDVFCLSANFIFQHELQRQKILFKVLLYAGTVD